MTNTKEIAMDQLPTKSGKYSNALDAYRYEILNCSSNDISCGLVAFQNARVKQIKELLSNGLISADAGHNDSPTVGEFLKIAADMGEDGLSFNGYIISNDRDDRRVTIDAVTIHIGESGLVVSEETKRTLKKWRESADETSAEKDTNGLEFAINLWWD
jgi:hypothetical protein